MNWLNLVLILIIGGFAAFEMIRGFGKGVIDALLLYAALFAADFAAPNLAKQVHFADGAAANHADADAALLIVFSVLSLFFSRWVWGMTMIDLGMFEKLMGLCTGLAAGVIVAHGVVHSIAMADPSGEHGAALVASSTVGNEVLDFPTYHAMMQTVTGANSYRQDLPAGVGK
jgi:uncharacterized membrane protein required for colicin V production